MALKNIYSRLALLLLLSSLFLQEGIAQVDAPEKTELNKGKFFAYWGWNRSVYSTSDMHFKGTGYDFRLENVVGRDKQSEFNVDTYLNPANATIPQFNFRVGYFIRENIQISLATDHMKYRMQSGQPVQISGHISDSGTIYDGIYTDDTILLNTDFLEFEHTDGLNYGHMGIRHFFLLKELGQFKWNFTEGIGFGLLVPKTNATLLNNERHDAFHLSGYGLDIVAGMNLEYKHYFVQGELKGGFINMPDIRTTNSPDDRASQSFFFSQLNLVFGAHFRIWKNKVSE